MLTCNEQGVSIMANRGNHIRHDEAAVSLKGRHTETCGETLDTATLRQSMHLDHEALGLIGICCSCGYLCLATQMYWPLLCPEHSMVGLHEEHYHALIWAFYVKRLLATLW